MSRTLSILIPTLDRGAIVLETIAHLMQGTEQADEILLLDQTAHHPEEITSRLSRLAESGAIQWIRLSRPSIPSSLNRGLLLARSELVLILDDDIIPAPDLVAAHRRAFVSPARWVVAGQVLQPWQEAESLSGGINREKSLSFPFHSTIPQPAANIMAGNVSMLRQKALDSRGFDERFTGAAYRFETDFAWRVIANGGEIWFEPSASVRHLKLPTGGLRTLGDFQRATNSIHTSGDYYFARLHMHGATRTRYILRRLRQNILNWNSLSHPWLLPLKVMGELAGYREGNRLFGEGRRMVD